MSIIKLLSLPAVLSAACLMYSCSSTKHAHATHTGTFISKPVVIDGNDSDWPSPYPNYDSKARISYAVANDRDNLYITVKASDRFMQRKLTMGGLTVWIDRNGKKEETAAINYPLQQSAAPAGDEDRPGARNAAGERPLLRDTAHHRNRSLAADGLTLSGFAGCYGNFRISDANPCNIRLRMDFNEYNELVWEAAVPLAAIYPNGKAAGRQVSVGFGVGGVPMPARSAGQGGHGGGMSMGGGMGGRGGGGMHGGGGMGRGGGGRGGGGYHPGGEDGEDYEALSHATKTWITTGIATQ